MILPHHPKLEPSIFLHRNGWTRSRRSRGSSPMPGPSSTCRTSLSSSRVMKLVQYLSPAGTCRWGSSMDPGPSRPFQAIPGITEMGPGPLWMGFLGRTAQVAPALGPAAGSQTVSWVRTRPQGRQSRSRSLGKAVSLMGDDYITDGTLDFLDSMILSH